MKAIQLLWDYYKYLFIEIPDPRSNKLPLMESPWPVLAIVALYLKFVTDWGRKFMENRQPYDITKILIGFNIVQIFSSAYVLIMAVRYTYFFGGYSFLCQPVDKSESSNALTTVHIIYVYFLIKLMDLLDTVFFILRKKWSQVTFLHIYHHTGMVLTIWCGTKFLPGGQSIFLPMLNSLVHIVMYTYYLLTVLYKKRDFLWWKKHITQLQMIQFLLLSFNYLSVLLHPYCGYPKLVGLYIFAESFSFLFLFGDFYYKAYIKKSPNAKL